MHRASNVTTIEVPASNITAADVAAVTAADVAAVTAEPIAKAEPALET